MTTLVDPVGLSGLKQAVYVMECIIKGYSEDEVVKMLGGDDQLFNMWKSFLMHNHWMAIEMDGWSMTEKGTEWSKRLTSW